MEWENGNCEKVRIRICYSGDDDKQIKVSQLPCTNWKPVGEEKEKIMLQGFDS
jgi:hypothetical protein